jgi:hypothetical protein
MQEETNENQEQDISQVISQPPRVVESSSPSSSSKSQSPPASPRSSHSSSSGKSLDDDSDEPKKSKDKASKSQSKKNAKDTSITTSTLWEDLDVAILNPADQIVMDKVGISENPILASMAEEIETRSLKGPNAQYSFTILAVAAISIALISYSNSVRESPILFRILWALAFMINFITVSIPGR